MLSLSRARSPHAQLLAVLFAASLTAQEQPGKVDQPGAEDPNEAVIVQLEQIGDRATEALEKRDMSAVHAGVREARAIVDALEPWVLVGV